MQLSPLDVGLVVLVLMCGLWGLLDGAIRTIAPFVALLAGLTLLHADPEVWTRFVKGIAGQSFLTVALTTAGLVIVLVLCGGVARMLHGAVWASGLGPLDRLFGLLVGLVTGTLLAGAFVWALQTYGGRQDTEILRSSTLAPPTLQSFESTTDRAARLVPRRLKELVKQPSAPVSA